MLDYLKTARTDIVDILHGIEVPDPYRWLEEIDSEQTQAWIEEAADLRAFVVHQMGITLPKGSFSGQH
jgi:prolyl oligopeptidase